MKKKILVSAALISMVVSCAVKQVRAEDATPTQSTVSQLDKYDGIDLDPNDCYRDIDESNQEACSE